MQQNDYDCFFFWKFSEIIPLNTFCVFLLLLQEEFRVHYKNITKIMDCVGCTRCRVWGKLQVKKRRFI